MPVAKIHVNEGVYAQSRIQNISNAVQSALLKVLKIPPDDFFQIIHELPKSHFLHTPSFLGLTYSDEFILLEVTFLAGRSRETRLALLKELNQRVAAQAGISKDDLVIMLYEIPGENASFGRGLAQRASVSAAA
jgi:Tautomerase enzyme